MRHIKWQNIHIYLLNIWNISDHRKYRSGPIIIGSVDANKVIKLLVPIGWDHRRKLKSLRFKIYTTLRWVGGFGFQIFPRFKWLKFGLDFDDIWGRCGWDLGNIWYKHGQGCPMAVNIWGRLWTWGNYLAWINSKLMKNGI